MESWENCVYVIYPKKFNDEVISLTLRNSLLISTGEPRLLPENREDAEMTGIQCFESADIDGKFPIDSVCRRVLSDVNAKGMNYTDCVVLKIPKAYLGSDPQSGLEMSPIFDMVKPGEYPGIQSDSFFIKNNLISSVYSGKYNQMIDNSNYSPVCDCRGVLSVEQRGILESKKNNDPNVSQFCSGMLELDKRVRNEESNTLGRLNKFTGQYEPCFNSPLSEEIYKLYMSSGKIPACVWQDNNPNRHKMTIDEVNKIFDYLRSRGM